MSHVSGPAQDAAHAGIRFQGRDPLPLLRDDGVLLRELHAAQLVEDLLSYSGGVGVGGRGVVRHVELHAVHRALRGAAAVSDLALEQVGVLQVLVADLADGVVSLARDRSLLVAHAPDLALQLVEAVGGTQVRLGDAVTAPVASATKTATAEQREEQDPGEPAAAHAAPAFAVAAGVVSRYGRDIGRAHVIHCHAPFFVIYRHRVALHGHNLKAVHDLLEVDPMLLTELLGGLPLHRLHESTKLRVALH